MAENRKLARELATDALRRGDAQGWFETLYASADRKPGVIPWADLTVNPNLSQWLCREKISGHDRNALVIGCGLGDDAEKLADLGFDVTAFDISPTCIDWCRQRFPNSSVHFLTADLLDYPTEWRHTFDFVFEAYTLQVLPPQLRQQAGHRIAQCLAPGGTLLIITRGRDDSEDSGNMPWPLVHHELDEFVEMGLTEVLVEDYIEAEDVPVRRFRAEYRNR